MSTGTTNSTNVSFERPGILRSVNVQMSGGNAFVSAADLVNNIVTIFGTNTDITTAMDTLQPGIRVRTRNDSGGDATLTNVVTCLLTKPG